LLWLDRVRLLLVSLPVLLVPSLAIAQPPSLTSETRPAPDAEPDAHIGGGILLPTAETQPAGTTIAGSYELAAMGLSYSPTDDLQLSLTALAPVAEDLPFIASPSVKLRLLGRERVHLALIASAYYGSDGEAPATAIAGGVAGSVCLDDACNSLLSATAGLAHLFFEDEENPDGMDMTVGGVSWVQRLAPRVKLLLEAGHAAVDPDSLGYVGYGLRLHGERLAADLTFLMDAEGGATDITPLGVPFVAVSARL
jgi:hypothetical protein